MTEDEAKETLTSEGFSNVHAWFDSPETEYLGHTPAVATAHLIIEGQMAVQINGHTTTYGSGQRVDVPAGAIHITKMGPAGCTYVSGQKRF